MRSGLVARCVPNRTDRGDTAAQATGLRNPAPSRIAFPQTPMRMEEMQQHGHDTHVYPM